MDCPVHVSRLAVANHSIPFSPRALMSGYSHVDHANYRFTTQSMSEGVL